jgi:hypothetical protein
MKLSDEPEIVERRLWYAARQKEAAACLLEKAHIPPWLQVNDNDYKKESKNSNDLDDPHYYKDYKDSYELYAQEISDQQNNSLQISQQEKQERQPQIKLFSTFALSLAEESLAKG